MQSVAANTNQLELPLGQVAQLLGLPSFVVVRLMARLKTTVAKPTSFSHKKQADLFFTLPEVQLLETCIQAIRQGHRLSSVLESLKQKRPLNPLQNRFPATVGEINTTVSAMKRLPAYKAKTPIIPEKKAIGVVKKMAVTTPHKFPILKKQRPPVGWFHTH